MSNRARIFLDKAEDLLPRLPADSFDSICTDPPYGLAELKPEIVIKALTAWLAGDRLHVPDGRGFMGREWDKFVPPPGIWDECYRLLKPGGYLLVFAAPRTADLMGLSIRLAGFEIRDSLHWLYGSGFSKGLDVSKAIDKAAGAQREIVGHRLRPDGGYRDPAKGGAPGASLAGSADGVLNTNGAMALVTAPATSDAARWQGWNTAIKPAHEPVIMARKPLSEGTVAANVLRWGTGALNVGGCKVQHANGADLAESQGKNRHADFGSGPRDNHVFGADERDRASQGNYDGSAGRWPPNLLLTHSADCQVTGTRRVKAITGTAAGKMAGKSTDIYGQFGGSDRAHERTGYADADGLETVQAWDCAPDCPVAELDRQSGVSTSSKPSANGRYGDHSDTGGNEIYGRGLSSSTPNRAPIGDTGGASRFFPQFAWDPELDFPFLYQAKAGKKERPRIVTGDGRVIQHPTVKPVALMRWLVRLVTPPGGTVGDFFCGTGPTVQACLDEGMRCVAADQDPESVALSRVRLAPYAGVKFTVPEPVAEAAS